MENKVDNKFRKFTPAGKIKMIKSSILNPENAGLRIIINPCAMDGKWTNKLQQAISKKWRKPQEEYKSWFVNVSGFKSGKIQTVAVQSDTWITNILCLDKDNKLDEEALKKCLSEVLKLVLDNKASIHISMLSTEIQPDLNTYSSFFSPEGIHTYFYEEPAK